MIRNSLWQVGLLLLLFNSCINETGVQSLDSKLASGNETDAIQEYTVDTSFLPPQEPGEKQTIKPSKQITQQSVDWDKKIIKTAHLNAEVKNYESYIKLVNETSKKYGGFISNEQQSQTVYKIENIVIIKVPVHQFDYAVNDLLQQAEKVHEKNIVSDDVTTQVIDGKSRLEAKRQVRLRYLDLLKQARNMEDILTVQKEINSIQEEIEMVNGRLAYLNHSAAMSTIKLTFFQVLNESAFNDDNPQFLSRVKLAFSNGLFWIGELLVGVISLWPLWLLAVCIVYLFRKQFAKKI